MQRTPSSLRTARLRAGLSQNKLAREAGVGRATVARIESDPGARPYPATLHVLAEALGVAVADIEPRNGAAP